MRRLILPRIVIINHIQPLTAVILQKKGESTMDRITIGMDLGDKKHAICTLSNNGKDKVMSTMKNDSKTIADFFTKHQGATVAMEAGTHSPWISRLVESKGCNVVVGNPRKLRMIWDSDDKDDNRDAELLAKVARFDPELLYPIHHRGERAHIDLELIKARSILVKSRCDLINHIRGSVKAVGCSLPKCSTPSFHHKVCDDLPDNMDDTLKPLLLIVGEITNQIKDYDKKIEAICKEKYPETELLRNIAGVGPITSLSYILTIEDPDRFKNSKQVGKFLGLTPKKDQSGEIDKQLRITKAGNSDLRCLLVQSAQYVLGPFGPDCDLRSFGQRLAERGGKNAKRRAIVAVARKLSVLMHRLWKNGEVYNPFHKQNSKVKKAA
jgi:transposase